MIEPAKQPLLGKRVALPETRELDVLAGLLERRGAQVLRCPLVAIHDAPDAAPVEQWLRAFIDGVPDDFIILTGEGIRRLVGFAERAGWRDTFIAALAKVRKIARGPKPGRALREIGLATDIVAAAPTTEGIITTLQDLDLAGRSVAVQLYGEEPNRRLMDYLASRGIQPRVVAPYVYADKAQTAAVENLIRRLAAGDVDAITFTSTPQVRRLQDVARETGLEALLSQGLAQVKVAAVGPIVADDLRERGIRVDVIPKESFFMKPLVTELVAALALRSPDPAAAAP